jgi:uncharacterized membrane protein
MDPIPLVTALCSLAMACTTCDGALQTMIASHRFSLLAATVAPVTLAGGFLIAYLARWWARTVAPAASGPDPGALAWSAALLGAALGALLDGIVFHQVLQVHDMISTSLPPTTLVAKNTNMFWSGIFYLAVYALPLVGIASLWGMAGRIRPATRPGAFWGALVGGAGAFNLYDTLTYHGVLRLHNIVEVTSSPWAWNIAWGIFGGALLVLGGLAMQRGLQLPRRSDVMAR